MFPDPHGIKGMSEFWFRPIVCFFCYKLLFVSYEITETNTGLQGLVLIDCSVRFNLLLTLQKTCMSRLIQNSWSSLGKGPPVGYYLLVLLEEFEVPLI